MKVNSRFLMAGALGMAMMALVGCGGQQEQGAQGATSETITISAAASMQGALNDIKAAYIKEHHLTAQQITINYGGSGTLRQQIEQGAPVSLFISANVNHMKKLEDKKLVEDVTPLAANSLVLISPTGKTTYHLDNLAEANKIAIGTPETVPAGKYAKETLTKLNLWSAVEPKLVYGKDVKAVLAYVREGAVDAGFVYKTDAMTAKDKVVMIDVPSDSHQPIIYPMALVKGHTNALAKDFYKFLQSPEAQKILTSYGFSKAPEKDSK